MAFVFPPSLKPAARSAYRAIIRSARITFAGDLARRQALTTAVRTTFSSPTLTTPTAAGSSSGTSASASASESSTAPATEEELSKRIQEWKDVALFLRRNVVQGQKTEDDTYRLRLTPHTELGDNASIKVPPVLPVTPFPNRNRIRRRREAEQAQATAPSP